MTRCLHVAALPGRAPRGPITAAADATRDLHALIDREWERELADNPFTATYLGDPRYNDRMPDISPRPRPRAKPRMQKSSRTSRVFPAISCPPLSN